MLRQVVDLGYGTWSIVVADEAEGGGLGGWA